MPEIRHFAVAGNGNGQLVIAAIAGPGPDDQQFPPGEWTGWSSLGFPAGGGQLTAVAPAVAQNQDGRLEVHLRVGEQIWHAWQKTAGSHDWVPWTSLGKPEGQGPVG